VARQGRSSGPLPYLISILQADIVYLKMNTIENSFSCPNCEESLNWSVPEGAVAIVESACPVCHAPLLLNQVTNSVEIQLPARRKALAFMSCSIWDVDKRVSNYFRGLCLAKGILPRTIGIDIYADTLEETAILARGEIAKADCVIAILTPRYTVNGHLSSTWTYFEPGMGFAISKPLFVFYETGTREENPLLASAQYSIEFDRELFGNQEEDQRLDYWIASIKEEINRRKSNRFWTAVGIGALTVLPLGLLIWGGGAKQANRT